VEDFFDEEGDFKEKPRGSLGAQHPRK
jgi:hypothetical protein